MELCFIRHAQSNNNALFAETGSWAARVPDPDIIPTQNGRLPNRPHTTQHLNTPVTRQKG